MSNYKFYTPSSLASHLIRLIPKNEKINHIADICCGTWNLLQAAKQHFPDSSIVGVDIDPTVNSSRLEGAVFHSLDGRDFADAAASAGVMFDLLLSNPPFGTIAPENKKYSSKEHSILSSRRYESELLYANYKILKENGFLLIILPVTYVMGAQYQSHRIWLSSNFDVLSIVSLPSDTFGPRTLNTVALVLKKGHASSAHETQFSIAQVSNGTWEISPKFTLSHNHICSGDWFFPPSSSVPKVTMYRGSISSHFFCESGTTVLHCSSNISNGTWNPSLRYCCNIKPSQEKYAETGDVIINRIGKHAGAWSIYSGNKCLISDCLIVIKHPSPTTVEKLRQSTAENGLLMVPALGVATKYISAKSILSLLS